MKGREKIFEVRRHYNDVTFIDEFLTPDFVRRHGLFTYEYDRRSGQYVISDRDFAAVKEKLLFMMTNFGQPWIEVTDGNFLNRGRAAARPPLRGRAAQARPGARDAGEPAAPLEAARPPGDDEPVVMQ
jgi:stage V sporulation protein R